MVPFSQVVDQLCGLVGADSGPFPPFPPLFVSVTLPLVSALRLSYAHLTQGGMAECKPGAHDLS